MSEKTAKKKRKKEPGWCGKCHAQICSCVIEQIRAQENALFASKQAIQSLDAMLKKTIIERDDFMKRNEELTDKVKGKTRGIIDHRMKEIDNQVSRFALRNKIAIN